MASITPVVSEEMFENVDTHTHIHTDDRAYLYYKLTNEPKGSGELIKQASSVIGKQDLAFGKSEKSEFINIEIFAASSGGRKGWRHIGSFMPDRERSHVCIIRQQAQLPGIHLQTAFT